MERFNSEGYYDPTMFEALSGIEREEKAAKRGSSFRPVVYICSPYAGDVVRHEKQARAYSRFAVEKKAIPVAPHLLFPQYMDESTERELALFMGMVLLGKCAQVWVFGDVISDGMAAEIAKAKKKGKVIRYFTEDLEEKVK